MFSPLYLIIIIRHPLTLLSIYIINKYVLKIGIEISPIDIPIYPIYIQWQIINNIDFFVNGISLKYTYTHAHTHICDVLQSELFIRVHSDIAHPASHSQIKFTFNKLYIYIG